MMIPNDKYIFQSVSTRQFFEWLQEVSPQDSRPRILIFTETKKGANALCRELRYEQFEAGAIHGDKDQAERDAILNNFRQGKCQILVATDVAQRGLDIKDVGNMRLDLLYVVSSDSCFTKKQTGQFSAKKCDQHHTSILPQFAFRSRLYSVR